MESATLIFRNEKDIVMHIAALVRIAMADGKFLDSEKAFITNSASLYAGAYGTKAFDKMVDETIPDLPKSALDEWMASLSDRPVEARNLIKDMIALAHVDGEYCTAEQQEIRRTADKLKVKKLDVAGLEKSLLDLLETTQKLQAIIECGCSEVRKE